jgi:Leucine-rich repeat (LRR) protein
MKSKYLCDCVSFQLSHNFLSQSLENANLASQPELQHLDLSRNNIANIAPGTFLGLAHLRELDLSVNALRTVSFSSTLGRQ